MSNIKLLDTRASLDTKLRAYIRAVLDNKCSQCGETQHLEIHHKDINRENNRLENLQLLCVPCHIKAHVECRLNLESQPNEPYVFRPKDFAKYFPIHENTMYAWIKKGIIKAENINGRIYIPKSEIRRLLNGVNGVENK